MIGVIKGTMRQKKEVTGLPLPIASFKANVKGNLKSLKVAITAVQSGSGDPSPDNIRPIIGWSECNVVRCGTNLLNLNRTVVVTSAAGSASTKREFEDNQVWIGITANNYFNNGIISSYSISSNGITILTTSPGYGIGFPFRCKPNTTYYINQSDNYNISLGFYDSDGTNISSTSKNKGTFTTPSNCYWVNVVFRPAPNTETTYSNPIVVLGSTAPTYESYNGNTYTIQLGDTCYGGSLDVTNGVLTVTHARIDMGTMNWFRQSTNLFYVQNNTIKGNSACICDIYAYQSASIPPTRNDKTINTTGYFGLHSLSVYDTDYDDKNTFKASLNGKYCVYELATPQTIQLTPIQVEQLLGANNVWADTGDVEELIYTDRQVYYGR